MKQQSKLSQEHQHTETHQTPAQTGHAFASSDELLRFDAAQTTVPPQIAERLKHSASGITPPKSGWIKRLFN